MSWKNIRNRLSKFKIFIIFSIIIIPVVIVSLVLINQSRKETKDIDVMNDVFLYRNVVTTSTEYTYILKGLELEGRFQAVYNKQIDFQDDMGYTFEYKNDIWIVYRQSENIENSLVLMKKTTFDSWGIALIQINDLFESTKQIIFMPNTEIIIKECKIPGTMVTDDNNGWNIIYQNVIIEDYILVFHTMNSGYGYNRINLAESEILDAFSITESTGIIYGNFLTGKYYMFKYENSWWFLRFLKSDNPELLIGAMSDLICAKLLPKPSDLYIKVKPDLITKITKNVITGYNSIILYANGDFLPAISLSDVSGLEYYGLYANSGQPRIFYEQTDIFSMVSVFKYGNTWFYIENIKGNVTMALNIINYNIYALDL